MREKPLYTNTHTSTARDRANSANGPDSDRGFQVKVVKPFKAIPSSLSSGTNSLWASVQGGALSPTRVALHKHQPAGETSSALRDL